MQEYFVTMLIAFNGISCFIPKFQRKSEEEKVHSVYYVGGMPVD